MVALKINLPNGFLDEEVRDGYKVSHEMKKVWAVELDLLAEFQRVCKKHNIKYIASGGTMLGAVRHKGFIPWDDDIDLMMLREEYEKLCKVAPLEFKHPYFFQTETTDPGYMRGFARLRNSETTAIPDYENGFILTINQGIFIDIFPMDNLVEDKILLKQQSDESKYLYDKYLQKSKYNYRFMKGNTIKNKILRTLLPLYRKLLYNIQRPDKILKKRDLVCQRYNKVTTKYVSLLSFQFDNRVHDIKREDMNHLIISDFEFLKIPNISNYDEALHWKFGDYLKPVISPTYHQGMLYDADKCYKEYL